MASAASSTFVQNLYSTILLRSGSAADVNSWATLLDSGLLTQAQELSAFETSGEAVGFVDPAIRMYQTFFGRAPDPAGLQGWVSALRSGAINMTGLAEGFSHSVEFTNRYGSNPNFSAFVTALYANVLGRSPDAPGLNGWVGFLSSGQLDYAQVALGFSNSPEFITNSTGAINNWLTAADANANAGAAIIYPNQQQQIPGIIPNSTLNQNFVLPTAIVNATATNFFASLTPFFIDGHGPTLLPGDTLTGAGSNNSLTVTDLNAAAADNLPAGVTLANIQNVTLNTSGNTAASGFSTVAVAGVVNLTVTTAGAAGDFVAAANGASGAAITVNHNSFAGGGVIVLGGTTVAVNQNAAGAVFVGQVAAGAVPAPANVATGAITVTDNSTGGGAVNIVGGTSVTVNATSSSYAGAINIGNFIAGNTPAGGIANPTGAISVTDASIAAGAGPITIYGGTTVNVTASGGGAGLGGLGTITVGDTTAVLASNEATGAITITDKAAVGYNGLPGSGNNNAVGAAIAAFGGTTVNVTSNIGGAIVVGTPANGAAKAALPTGAVTVSNTGLDLFGNAPVVVAGGTNVSVTNAGGAIAIGGAPVGGLGISPSGTIVATETFGTLYTNHPAIGTDGGTTTTVTALGQNVTVGANVAPTGAVTVSQSGLLTGAGAGAGFGAVAVNGGTTVGVTTTGGSVAIGGATGVPSGAVTITDTFSGTNAANTDAFTVLGATTVSIATTATGGAVTVGAPAKLNATGTALTNTGADPSGNVTINNSQTNNGVVTYGTGATNVFTNGATTVSITGGTVANVVDDQSTLATGGAAAGKAVGTSTLATVVLDGVTTPVALPPTIAVQSDALASLTVLDTPAAAGSVTVTDNTAGHTLALVVGNIGKGGLTVTDAKAGTLSISDNGKVGSLGTNPLTIAGASDTTLAFANSASMTATITAAALPALATITDSGAGSLALGNLFALGGLKSINAGGAAGAVTAEINPGVTSFTGGTGANVLTIDSNALGAGVKLNGGGNGTIVANYASSVADTALGSTASITGFTTLGLGALADSTKGGSYSAAGFSGVNILGQITNNVVIGNASAGAQLALTGGNPLAALVYAGTVSYQLLTYTGNDSLAVSIGIDGPAFVGTKSITGTVIAPNIQNISIASKGLIGGNANTLTLQDSLASSFTFTGDQVVNVNLKSDPAFLGAGMLSSGSSASTLNASGATGPVNVAQVFTAGAYTSGIATSASGVNATGGAALFTVSGALGDTGTIVGADKAASIAQVNTVKIGNDTVGDKVTVTVNGVSDFVTATGNATTDATTLFNTLKADAKLAGFTFLNPSAGQITITNNTTGVLFSSTASVTAASPGSTTATDTITTAFANYKVTAANDSFTSGAGGATITIGAGGAWNQFLGTPAYDTGSETVNLTASAGAVDTLLVIDGATATFNGAKGGVTGFVVSPSVAAADQVAFESSAGTFLPKTVLGNNGTTTAVSATDAANLLAILLPGSSLANLTWTSSNGVITFGATGGHSVGEFSTAQLIAAAEIIVDEAAQGGKSFVGSFVSGGNSFVVSSGASGTVTKALNDNSVVQLLGVTGITGFGPTAGQGTIVDGTAGNLTLQLPGGAGNLGSVKGAAFNDLGFAADTFNTGAAGVTNSFTNLAPSAQLNITGAAIVGPPVNDLGNLATTQTGAPATNNLTLNFTGTTVLDSASLPGDAALFITAGAAATITSLVDPGNTLAAITISGANNVKIASITDTALTTISAAGATGAENITANQAGLKYIGSVAGPGDTFSGGGAGDVITMGNGANTVTAVGSTDVITVGNGANTITANGAGDTITLGTGANLVVATGVGDIIKVNAASAAANDITVGSNASVTVGTGADIVRVTGDVAGTVSSFGFTTITGAHAGTSIFLNNLGGNATGSILVGNEFWLGNEGTNGTFGAGGAAAASEVNVSGAASLAAAVNLAAAQAAAKNLTGAAPGTIAAATGVVDWFQFGGNTFIVEAVNASAAPAAHSALASGDIVIELVGLVTPSANALGAASIAGHTLTL